MSSDKLQVILERRGEIFSSSTQLLKTAIKLSRLPPTARQVWLRFREACDKLNMPEVQELLGGCYGMRQLKRENLQEVVDEACRLVNDGAVKTHIPRETSND